MRATAQEALGKTVSQCLVVDRRHVTAAPSSKRNTMRQFPGDPHAPLANGYSPPAHNPVPAAARGRATWHGRGRDVNGRTGVAYEREAGQCLAFDRRSWPRPAVDDGAPTSRLHPDTPRGRRRS